MNGRVAKMIRHKAKLEARVQGRTLRETMYNIKGEVVSPDEIRQIKKEYKNGNITTNR